MKKIILFLACTATWAPFSFSMEHSHVVALLKVRQKTGVSKLFEIDRLDWQDQPALAATPKKLTQALHHALSGLHKLSQDTTECNLITAQVSQEMAKDRQTSTTIPLLSIIENEALDRFFDHKEKLLEVGSQQAKELLSRDYIAWIAQTAIKHGDGDALELSIDLSITAGEPKKALDLLTQSPPECFDIKELVALYRRNPPLIQADSRLSTQAKKILSHNSEIPSEWTSCDSLYKQEIPPQLTHKKPRVPSPMPESTTPKKDQKKAKSGENGMTLLLTEMYKKQARKGNYDEAAQTCCAAFNLLSNQSNTDALALLTDLQSYEEKGSASAAYGLSALLPDQNQAFNHFKVIEEKLFNKKSPRAKAGSQEAKELCTNPQRKRARERIKAQWNTGNISAGYLLASAHLHEYQFSNDAQALKAAAEIAEYLLTTTLASSLERASCDARDCAEIARIMGNECLKQVTDPATAHQQMYAAEKWYTRSTQAEGVDALFDLAQLYFYTWPTIEGTHRVTDAINLLINGARLANDDCAQQLKRFLQRPLHNYLTPSQRQLALSSLQSLSETQRRELFKDGPILPNPQLTDNSYLAMVSFFDQGNIQETVKLLEEAILNKDGLCLLFYRDLCLEGIFVQKNFPQALRLTKMLYKVNPQCLKGFELVQPFIKRGLDALCNESYAPALYFHAGRELLNGVSGSLAELYKLEKQAQEHSSVSCDALFESEIIPTACAYASEIDSSRLIGDISELCINRLAWDTLDEPTNPSHIKQLIEPFQVIKRTMQNKTNKATQDPTRAEEIRAKIQYLKLFIPLDKLGDLIGLGNDLIERYLRFEKMIKSHPELIILAQCHAFFTGWNPHGATRESFIEKIDQHQ